MSTHHVSPPVGMTIAPRTLVLPLVTSPQGELPSPPLSLALTCQGPAVRDGSGVAKDERNTWLYEE